MLSTHRVEQWLRADAVDAATKAAISQMSPEECQSAFSTSLDFGTAGLRGKMGPGPNRMNVYTVRSAAHAVAAWLLEGGETPSAVIGYDMRHFSKIFAEESAFILQQAGVKAYLFDRICATPELSYAIRFLGCRAGIMVTASHNSKDDNGYKVYRHTGSQILSEDAERIAQKMAMFPPEEMRTPKSAKLLSVGEEVLRAYQKSIDRLLQCEDDPTLTLVYTPLNGCGIRPGTELLRRHRYTFSIPEPQGEYDPDFTTIPEPNPEYPKTLSLAVRMMHEEHRDLVIANDPDADRMNAVVRLDEDAYYFTGNTMGALLADYVLSRDRAREERPVFVQTVVSSPFAKAIAQHYGAKVEETLTGFKNIAEIANRIGSPEYPQYDGCRFSFGYEESIGFMISDTVRDKDGLSAMMVFAECANRLKQEGKTPVDRLEELYRIHGYWAEKNGFSRFSGVDGMRDMRNVMHGLRRAAPKYFADRKILKTEDFLRGQDAFYHSDVLRFTIEGGVVAIRPSGTEPKLKHYIYICDREMKRAEEVAESVEQALFACLGFTE